MILVGDIHGNILTFKEAIKKFPNKQILQVGDFGVGFYPTDLLIPQLSENISFIRGNHDNPKECEKIPGYMGNFGCFPLNSRKAFYVSGADSIDKKWRTENVDWWKDEQLDPKTMDEAKELYGKIKPDIMISHDGPFCIHQVLKAACVCKNPDNEGFGPAVGNFTSKQFDEFLKIHRPKYWIFGHWHVPIRFKYKDTTFICLDCFETLDTDTLE